MSRRAAIVIGLLLGTGAATAAVWRTLSSQSVSGPAGVIRGSDALRDNGVQLFEDATAPLRIDFVHEPGPISLYQVPQVTGSGCAFLDFDRDGLLDIFLVNQAAGAGFEGISSPVKHEGGGPTHRLYRQEADGKFIDVTRGSGLDVTDVGQGVAVGDVNNDGFPDIYLACYGPDRLFLNRRDGTFVDVTQSAGIDNLVWGTACVFVDFDRDGWLDLFVANYVDYHTTRRCADPGGPLEFCNPKTFVGTPHKLYRNETGDLIAAGAISREAPLAVRFRDVSLTSGIARKTGPGLGVVAADFDGDGWPDFFVANDGAANFLWINQHDGTFTEEAVLRGAAYDLTGHPQANMGIAVGDVDGDGRPDLFVTHFQGEMDSLYRNTPDGFEESAVATGLGAASLPYTKWGTAFLDVDHDGDLDLAIVNGRVKRAESPTAPGGWLSYAEPNQFFLNDGTGHFVEHVSTAEAFRNRQEIYRGLAVGDVDNDGDLDLLVTTVAGPALLYRNVAPKNGHWLMIRAIEPALGGRDAHGAQVTVSAGERRWTRQLSPAYSFFSSNDPRVHFGLGQVERVDGISVIWPDGAQEHFDGCGVDQHLVLRRGEGRAP